MKPKLPLHTGFERPFATVFCCGVLTTTHRPNEFMKTKFKRFQARLFCAVALGIGSSFSLAASAEDWADTACLPIGMAPAKTSIPWPACRGGAGRSQLGAKGGADYKGDGLAVIPTAEGARLRCVFQRLE